MIFGITLSCFFLQKCDLQTPASILRPSTRCQRPAGCRSSPWLGPLRLRTLHSQRALAMDMMDMMDMQKSNVHTPFKRSLLEWIL